MIDYKDAEVQGWFDKKVIDDYERNLRFDRMANDVEYLKSIGVYDTSEDTKNSLKLGSKEVK